MSFRGRRVVTYLDMVCDYMPKTEPDYHIDFVGQAMTNLVARIFRELKPEYVSVQSIGAHDAVLCLLPAPLKVEPTRSEFGSILLHEFADWQLIHGADNIVPWSIDASGPR